MADLATRLEIEDLKENLRAVQELLHRHKLVESLVARQDMPKQELVEQMVHRQHLAELRGKIERLHPADIAFILESLPLDERLLAWDLVKADRDGEILLEVSDAVRESLIASMDSPRVLYSVPSRACATAKPSSSSMARLNCSIAGRRPWVTRSCRPAL